MSRRRKSFRREITPDPIYNDVTVARFIKKVMLDGKKSTAEKLVYSAFDELKTKVADEEPLTVFKTAIENKLTNTRIVNTIRIDERRVQIQEELNFIRKELQLVAPEYHKNIEDQKQIEYIAGLNEQLILNSRNLIKSWSKYHGQMEHFFAKKQKLSLNELKLYINEMKALKKELDQQQR